MAVVYTDIYEQFNKPRVDKVAYSSDYSGEVITSGDLEKDVRYTFISIGSGADFSNLGAESALATDQYFYATEAGSPTNWGGAELYAYMSPSDIITNEIANAVVKFQSIADYCGTTYSTDNLEIALALKYFTFYLLYLRSQSEDQGKGEYDVAISILTEQWGNSVIDYFAGVSQNTDTDIAIVEMSNEKTVIVSVPDWEDVEDYV